MPTFLTNLGKGVVALDIGNASTYYVGWGTGAVPSAPADTDVSTPAPEARVAGTRSTITTVVANDTVRWIGTIVASAARTITNAGLFDGVGSGSPPSGGTIIIHGDHTSTILAGGEAISYTITLQVV